MDMRRNHPYAAYENLAINLRVHQKREMPRRMLVPFDVVREPLNTIGAAVEHSGRCALSTVEGWRGEIVYWNRAGADQRPERCKIQEPSLHHWPALVEAVQGNIIADFPVINKSFNPSYSGTDR
jgi:Ni,Fe-hydrogenase III large subunit